jgi:hypothetical protein
MPLSENEQRLLEQMEKALYAEDSKFAASFRGSDVRRRKRRQLGVAVVGFVLGLGLLMAGVATPVWILGLVGFLVMLASAMYVLSTSRRTPSPLEVVTGEGETRPPRRGRRGRKDRGAVSRGSFMERLEERWRRRRDTGY